MTPDRNVFDDFSDSDEPVPLVAEIDGERKTIGEARLSKQGDFIHAEVDFKTDDPEDVRRLFGRLDVGGISIADVAPDVTEEDAQALFEFEPHHHHTVDHNDGRNPYCDFCGLDVSMQKPAIRPWGRQFGTPSRPIHPED